MKPNRKRKGFRHHNPWTTYKNLVQYAFGVVSESVKKADGRKGKKHRHAGSIRRDERGTQLMAI